MPPSVELTSGAAQFGIRLPVFLESSVLDRYAEIDFALGLNTAGVILSLLACRVRAVRSAVENEVITVCLLRREDAQLIELDLRIHRVFLRNRHCLLLVPEQERAAAFGLHQFCRSENNIS